MRPSCSHCLGRCSSLRTKSFVTSLNRRKRQSNASHIATALCIRRRNPFHSTDYAISPTHRVPYHRRRYRSHHLISVIVERRSLYALFDPNRSILCVNPRSSTPSSLSSFCPFNTANAVYQCGVGRLSTDGAGWIGSAYGDDQVNASSAQGFVYLQAATIQNSSNAPLLDGVYVLTAPHRYPTYYGVNDHLRQWNVSQSPTELISVYCIPPLLADNKMYAAIRSTPPISREMDVLHTSMQSICVQAGKPSLFPAHTSYVVCGLLLSGRAICWGNNSFASVHNLPIISPPGWLHFSQITCADTIICGIISNPSLMGRLFCWPSATPKDVPTFRMWDMSTWEVMVLANSADLSVQQAMMSEWMEDVDLVRRCQVALSNATSPPEMVLTTVDLYYRSRAFLTTTELTSAGPFISMSVAAEKDSLTLLSANGLSVSVWWPARLALAWLLIQPVIASPFPLLSALILSTTVSAGISLPSISRADSSIHVWSRETYIPSVTSAFAVANISAQKLLRRYLCRLWIYSAA